MTDIVGEISAASTEQSQGVSQVGKAVTQMDRVTQQNAALVEEMAAAASSLKTQAGELVQTVAVFRLGADDAAQGMASPVAVRAPAPATTAYQSTERRVLAAPSKPAAHPAARNVVAKAAPAAGQDETGLLFQPS